MNASGDAPKRSVLVAGFAILALAVPVASADAAVKMKVKGWTTQGTGTSTDVKNKKTIKNCRTDGANNRRLAFIFEGKGIGKNKEIYPVLSEAKDAPADFPYVWPVGKSKTHTQRWGIGFPGTFGPEDIDGDWFATIWFEDKIIARGEVKVKCGNT